ncbi:homeobox protein ESX1-like [Hyaena hyaena]|uniref:homeobox protein ESX1-like n=1 Tax=Hyaena hyaena TaxID=95912 RepID=UPI001923CC42|nr:homeobox protein ESX1-like [Hyaena hyaena]
MEPFKREVTGSPSTRNEEDPKEPREPKQEEMSPTRDGAAGDVGAEFAPEQAEIGIQVKVEGNSDSEDHKIGEERAGDLGAGYLWPAGPETRDVCCGRSPRQLEPQVPRQEGQMPEVAVQGPAQRRQYAGPRMVFNQLQVYHLESLFQRTPYPNATTRQELARFMDVPVARVQVWFKNKRAKLRRQQRALRLRNMVPMPMGPPVIINLGRAYRGVLVRQPGCVQMPQEPAMPAMPAMPRPPGPPMQPFPPMFLPPPGWFRPPVPPCGCPVAPCGCPVAPCGCPVAPCGCPPPIPNYGYPQYLPPCGYPLPLPPHGYPPPFPPCGYPRPPIPPMAHPRPPVVLL